jgi:hypothetical protein
MRASLFLKRRKASICTAKTTSEVARAVRKATRLMPVEVRAEPVPSALVCVGSASLLVADDILDCDIPPRVYYRGYSVMEYGGFKGVLPGCKICGQPYEEVETIEYKRTSERSYCE